MELEQAFTFLWKDKDWPKKLGIAAVLTLTLIGTVGVFGWLGELARRVAHNEEEPLPDWTEIGEYFLNGLKFIAITFIWALPATLIIIFTSSGFVLTAMADDPGPFFAVLSVFSMCLYILVFLFILAINLLAPALWLLVAEGGSFREMLNPKHAWDLIRANIGSYLVAMLIGWLVATVLSPLGAVACLVGAFFTTVISQAILAHLVGQATRQARVDVDDSSEPTAN